LHKSEKYKLKLFFLLMMELFFHRINLPIPINGARAGKKTVTIVTNHCITIFVGINFQIMFDVPPNPINPNIMLINFPIKLANNLGIPLTTDLALFLILFHILF